MRSLILIGVLLGLSAIPSAIHLLDSLGRNSQIADAHAPLVRASPSMKSFEYEGVDDSAKVAIITVQLRSLTKKDHVVMQGNLLYLLVSEEIFARLPKSINGLTIKLYTGSTMPNENDVSYLDFTRWARKDESVWVTSTAHFAGGNIGGCNEQYVRSEKGIWTRAQSECFAAAS
jgi:hypothetical protein